MGTSGEDPFEVVVWDCKAVRGECRRRRWPPAPQSQPYPRYPFTAGYLDPFPPMRREPKNGDKHTTMHKKAGTLGGGGDIYFLTQVYNQEKGSLSPQIGLWSIWRGGEIMNHNRKNEERRLSTSFISLLYLLTYGPPGETKVLFVGGGRVGERRRRKDYFQIMQVSVCEKSLDIIKINYVDADSIKISSGCALFRPLILFGILSCLHSLRRVLPCLSMNCRPPGKPYTVVNLCSFMTIPRCGVHNLVCFAGSFPPIPRLSVEFSPAS